MFVTISGWSVLDKLEKKLWKVSKIQYGASGSQTKTKEFTQMKESNLTV